MNNHVIDPAFFLDAIDMYAFNYIGYIVKDVIRDEYGMQKSSYDKVNIRGSLQTQGVSLNQKKSGNIASNKFKFYSSSSYRLNIGDFIIWEGKLLHVTDMQPYHEYGVRECVLEMTQLNEHRDLAEFIHLQTGDIRI
jgi:hypothetical protein